MNRQMIIMIAMTIMLSSVLSGNEISDTNGVVGDYHYEKLTTTDVGDNILARYASDANAPIKSWTRTIVVQRSNVPQQHEWESLTTISNIADNYKVKDSYAIVFTNGKAKLPKNHQSFQFNGKFSYSVSSRNMNDDLKDIKKTINKSIPAPKKVE